MKSLIMVTAGILAMTLVGCGPAPLTPAPDASFQTKLIPIGLDFLKGSNQSSTGAGIFGNSGQANAIGQSGNNASYTNQNGLVNIAPTVQPNVNVATPLNIGNIFSGGIFGGAPNGI